MYGMNFNYVPKTLLFEFVHCSIETTNILILVGFFAANNLPNSEAVKLK